jgi:hypothetical protein
MYTSVSMHVYRMYLERQAAIRGAKTRIFYCALKHLWARLCWHSTATRTPARLHSNFKFTMPCLPPSHGCNMITNESAQPAATRIGVIN